MMFNFVVSSSVLILARMKGEGGVTKCRLISMGEHGS